MSKKARSDQGGSKAPHPTQWKKGQAPPGKRWAPGQSGNPGGRPKKLKELEAEFWRRFAEEPFGRYGSKLEAVLDRMCIRALQGSDRAATVLLDRILGKAVQRTELTGAEGGPVDFTANAADMTTEDLRRRLAGLITMAVAQKQGGAAPAAPAAGPAGETDEGGEG